MQTMQNMQIMQTMQNMQKMQIMQNLQTKPINPNLPNQTYQTKPTKPNLPNQTCKTEPTKLNLLVKAVNAWVRSAFGNVFTKRLWLISCKIMASSQLGNTDSQNARKLSTIEPLLGSVSPIVSILLVQKMGI